MYVICFKAFYTDGVGSPEISTRTKKGAERLVRSMGYKWCSFEGIFTHERDQMIAQIIPTQHVDQ